MRKHIIIIIFGAIVALLLTTTISEKISTKNKDIPSTGVTKVEFKKKKGENDSDIEINRGRSPIKVNLDGKIYEVKRNAQIGTVLEDEKLVVTENEDLTLNINRKEEPMLKKGLYIENNIATHKNTIGIRLSYQSKDNDLDFKYDPIHSEGSLMYTRWF